jgi:hypothetical protein
MGVRPLVAMTAMAVVPRRLDELDWHRVLDVIVLLRRPRCKRCRSPVSMVSMPRVAIDTTSRRF